MSNVITPEIQANLIAAEQMVRDKGIEFVNANMSTIDDFVSRGWTTYGRIGQLLKQGGHPVPDKFKIKPSQLQQEVLKVMKEIQDLIDYNAKQPPFARDTPKYKDRLNQLVLKRNDLVNQLKISVTQFKDDVQDVSEDANLQKLLSTDADKTKTTKTIITTAVVSSISLILLVVGVIIYKKNRN